MSFTIPRCIIKVKYSVQIFKYSLDQLYYIEYYIPIQIFAISKKTKKQIPTRLVLRVTIMFTFALGLALELSYFYLLPIKKRNNERKQQEKKKK